MAAETISNPEFPNQTGEVICSGNPCHQCHDYQVQTQKLDFTVTTGTTANTISASGT